jgi:hypothetical protein
MWQGKGCISSTLLQVRTLPGCTYKHGPARLCRLALLGCQGDVVGMGGSLPLFRTVFSCKTGSE